MNNFVTWLLRTAYLFKLLLVGTDYLLLGTIITYDYITIPNK